MFEGIVSDLVLKICGDYVQDLNKEQLNISIWSGKFAADAGTIAMLTISSC